MPIRIDIFNKYINLEGPQHPSPSNNTKCHIWMGREQHHRAIYGNKQAHRIIWELTNGEIPKDKYVCHTCDRGLCVNLAHLYLGTHEQNMKDMKERGRAKGCGKKGTRNGASKLTKEEIISIRADTTTTNKALGTLFKVSEAQISRIKSGTRWTDLTEELTREQEILSCATKGKFNEELGSHCLETITPRQKFSYNGATTFGYRIAWMIQHDSIPDGKFVLHKCDNDRCINHAHLKLGDHEENMRDRSERGRTAKGATHGMVVLTDAQVIDIYKNKDNKRTRELAKQYNISRSSIVQIRAGVTWSHITSLLTHKNNNGRLSSEQVLAIYNNTNKSISELATIYNKSYETIRSIQNGTSWKHITSNVGAENTIIYPNNV